jgi:predicted Zn-dependent peptidase
MSSRLFQEVREKRGLAYSVWSDRAAFSDAGTLSVSAGTAPQNVDELLKIFSAELDRMRDGGITERELEVAHGKSRAETVMALEDSGARMSRLGSSLLLEDEVREVDDVLATIEAVDVADVSRVATEYLSLPRTLAVVGPFNSERFESFFA